MSQVKNMSAEQLNELLQSGEAILVDIREPDEYIKWRIPRAILMPLDDVEQQIVHLSGEKRKIVFQCLDGKCSQMAVEKAISQLPEGIDVYSLIGGIDAWNDAGFAVIRESLDANGMPKKISIMGQFLIAGGGIIALSSLAAMIGWKLGPFIAFMMGVGLAYAGATGKSGLMSLIQRMPWNKK